MYIHDLFLLENSEGTAVVALSTMVTPYTLQAQREQRHDHIRTEEWCCAAAVHVDGWLREAVSSRSRNAPEWPFW